MFWTVLVHLQEQCFISFTSLLVYAITYGCCVDIGSPSYSHTTARRIGTYQMRCTVKNRWTKQSENVEHLMKNQF